MANIVQHITDYNFRYNSRDEPTRKPNGSVIRASEWPGHAWCSACKCGSSELVIELVNELVKHVSVPTTCIVLCRDCAEQISTLHERIKEAQK